MQIREIHIDRFGVFADAHISNVQPGLNIVYGKNEFGKTTLLEFVRWVLFGFDRRRGGNPYEPVAGGAHSGRLVCETDEGKTIVISRVGGSRKGKVTVRAGDRELEGQEGLDPFLGHASHKIFQNIYAFTLDELQHFDSLMEEDIKNKILGAGLGLGSVSLTDVRKKLEDQSRELFAPRSPKSRVKALGEEIRTLESEKKTLQEQLGQYGLLERKQDELLSQNETQEKEIQKWTVKKHLLEKHRELYPEFVELENAEKELSLLGAVGDFPERGFEDFKNLRSEMDSLRKRWEEETGVLDELNARAGQTVVPESLLKCENDVTRLQQLTESVRSAIQDRPGVQHQLEELTDRSELEIERLGDPWDEKKVLDFFLSETERGFVSTQSDLLGTATQKVRHLESKLEDHYERKAAESSKEAPLPAWLKKGSKVLMALGGIGLVGAAVMLDIPLGIFSLLVIGLGIWVYRWQDSHQAELKPEDKLEFHYKSQLHQARKEEEDKFSTWRTWLQEKGLSPLITPMALMTLVATVREIQGMISQRGNLNQRVLQMQKTVDEATGLVKKLSDILPDVEPVRDLVANIDLIARCFEEQRRTMEKQKSLHEQIQSQTVKVQGLEGQRKKRQAEWNELLKTAGVNNETEFLQKHQTRERGRELQSLAKQKCKTIQSRVGLGKAYDEFIQNMRSRPMEDVEAELEEVQVHLQTLHEKQKELNRDIGETRGKRQQLDQEDALLGIQMELEVKREQLNRSARQWASATLAVEMLERAKREYEKNRQPGVIRSAESLFSFISEGNYRRIIKPIDKEELLIENDRSESRSAVEMSRGTREQLYLAMRFGLITEYETRSEPLPILMDDVFVNFDDDRRERLAETLKKFSQNRQVIVLSCHRHTLDLFSSLEANPLKV